MSHNSFFSKSNSIKITHIILFIVTAMYILESIFIRGLFTNVYLALINMGLSIITLIISAIKKEYKLVIIDFIILIGTVSIFTYLIYL
ncbi:MULTISPECIES: hypothetical protein [unclassified Clostridium]|uniref:hypothetical protein n=1 Tax=unclassified Clostridium TaxID=2614128 RepID=UPI0025ED5ED5|nr:hypothetical protein [Clostridium sp.]MCI6692142.1 hypothetical protein [Clostridium sp.]MDY4252905.1 hypothetical protein [Clostridium sp.]MDY6227252.1 hypothetical protein [Clostridium sp.]